MRLSLVAAAAFAASSYFAYADTYAVYSLHQGSGNYADVGFTNNGGSLVLKDFYGNYVIYTLGQDPMTVYTEPALNNGDGPGTFTLSAMSSGTSAGTLSVLNSAMGTSQEIFDGEFVGAIVNSFGDVALEDISDRRYSFSDVNLYFVNETTHAAAITPEPSSFALLGTGLLGVAGVVRKRFA